MLFNTAVQSVCRWPSPELAAVRCLQVGGDAGGGAGYQPRVHHRPRNHSVPPRAGHAGGAHAQLLASGPIPFHMACKPMPGARCPILWACTAAVRVQRPTPSCLSPPWTLPHTGGGTHAPHAAPLAGARAHAGGAGRLQRAVPVQGGAAGRGDAVHPGHALRAVLLPAPLRRCARRSGKFPPTACAPTLCQSHTYIHSFIESQPQQASCRFVWLPIDSKVKSVRRWSCRLAFSAVALAATLGC